eukprot:15484630-Alexandrium_andersonii.AAC.1
MSASLVGSEMCIRDRGAFCVFVFALSPNLPTKAGLEGVRGRDIAKSQGPIRNPPIRNARNPLLLERERPG